MSSLFDSPMLSSEVVSALARDWSTGMIAATGKGLVLLSLAMMATWMLSRRAAATRHLVWTLAVAGLVALPLLSAVVPAWQVKGLPQLSVSLEPPVEQGTTSTQPTPGFLRADPSPQAMTPQPFESQELANGSGQSGTTALFRRDHEGTNAWRAVSPDQEASFATVGGTGAAARPVSGPALPALLARVAGDAARWDATVWLLLVWELGALAVAAWFGLGLWRLRNLCRASVEIEDPEWLDLLDRLCARIGLDRSPKLMWTEQGLTPMTWGVRNAVILLPREAEDWSHSRRNDVLLHELAHVQRKDILTQLLAQAGCVLFWFHPLPWIAAGRMRLERERACDDRVLMAGSRPSTYASHLLEMARSLRSEPALAAATVAMARKSQLGERMESLLDHRTRGRALGRATRALAVTAAALVLVPLASLVPGDPEPVDAAPPDHVLEQMHGVHAPYVWTVPQSGYAYAMDEGGSVAAAPEPHSHKHAQAGSAPAALAQVAPRTPRAPRTPSTADAPRAPAVLSSGNTVFGKVSIGGDDQVVLHAGRMWHGDMEFSGDDYELEWDDGSFTLRENDYELYVEIDGTVRFREDETDVEWMDDRSYFELEEEDGRDRRRLVIEVDRDGKMERRYFEGRSQEGYGDEAKAWFSRALQNFLLQAGVGIERRVERWVESDGLDGALARIDDLEGDWIRSRYWSTLFELGSLSDEQRREVARNFPRDLDSDFEKARLLTESHGIFLADDELRGIYFDVAGSMDSDFERSRALQVALSTGDLDPGLFGDVVVLVGEMDSDFEKARVLQLIPAEALDDPEIQVDYIEALRDMDSDFERSRTLIALADGRRLHGKTAAIIAEILDDMDSDFEKARVLHVIGDVTMEDPEARASVLKTVDGLDSDFEKARVMMAMIDRYDLDKETLLSLLEITDGIDSDFEKVRVLGALAPHVDDEELEDAYLRVADEIDSEFEYGRAMKMLRRQRRGDRG